MPKLLSHEHPHSPFRKLEYQFATPQLHLIPESHEPLDLTGVAEVGLADLKIGNKISDEVRQILLTPLVIEL
jgi:hypothetical protein